MRNAANATVKNSPRRSGSDSVAASANANAESVPDPLLASMQPTELRAAMDVLGHSTQGALAREIGVDRSTVSLWLEGRVGVPRPIAKLVRILLMHDVRAAP